MKRPTENDEPILLMAANALADDVFMWCQDAGVSRQDIVDDLVKAIKWRRDGYEIARYLDGKYDPDAELVEILDRASFEKRRAKEKAEKEWIATSGLSPIPSETKVRWDRYPEHDGIVTENHPEGRATVMYPHLGHVREGIGSHGYIVEWERLTIRHPQ